MKRIWRACFAAALCGLMLLNVCGAVAEALIPEAGDVFVALEDGEEFGQAVPEAELTFDAPASEIESNSIVASNDADEVFDDVFYNDYPYNNLLFRYPFDYEKRDYDYGANYIACAGYDWYLEEDERPTTVVIPSEVLGLTVAEIAEYAFGDIRKVDGKEVIKKLEKVVLPETITKIGRAAFACNKLKSFTFPQAIKVIPGMVLYNCPDLTSVTFAPDITEIDGCAFEGCSSLRGITIPDSVTRIGRFALRGCASITSMEIPGGVKSIEDLTFQHCRSLKKVKLNNGLKTIDEFAFDDCLELKDINFPDTLTTIGLAAFRGCGKLEKIDLPGALTTIGKEAFYDCKKIKKVTLPSGLKTIGDIAFMCSPDMKSITIPASVKSIGDYAIGYYEKDKYIYKIADFIIYGKKGSAAETYAKKNGFYFVDPDAPKLSPKLAMKSATVGKGEQIENILSASSKVKAKDCAFSYSKAGVVKVDAEGKLTALKAGTTTVTVKSKAYRTTAKLKLTVKKAPAKVQVTPAKKTLKVGKTLKLKVKLPAGAASYGISFTSNKPKVASVSKTGKITALKAGKAVITVQTYNGKKTKVAITVKK